MSDDETRVMTPRPRDGGAATVLRPDPAGAYGIPAGTLLVNTYRVECLLGGGGMGEVYLTRHAGLGTRHAVKVIRPAMALNRQVMDLFYREAKVLRGVRHDAVVSYDGFVRDDQGRDYLVMEYVEGPSLADRLRRGPLSPPEVLALRDRLAAGLAEAHRQGAVHRDLAPDNVILPGDRIEAAKLIDFGVCKLTDPTQETIVGASFAGKYRFASPEQLGLFGGGVDARSDIYSLGLILAAAAQGRPLDMGGNPEAALRSRQSVPDLSGVPVALRGWLAAMLQPDPAGRPGSLEGLLAQWPAGAGNGPGGMAIGPRGRRSPGPLQHGGRYLGWAMGLLVLVGLGGGLHWLLLPLPVDQRPTPPPIQPVPQPPPEVAHTDIGGLVRVGRFEDAFALAQERLASGNPPPADETWALAQALLGTGRLDQAFALVRELARAGHGPAALALAEMYDPQHWSSGRSPLSQPNGAKALEWYRRAAQLGVQAAEGRIEDLGAVEGGP